MIKTIDFKNCRRLPKEKKWRAKNAISPEIQAFEASAAIVSKSCENVTSVLSIVKSW